MAGRRSGLTQNVIDTVVKLRKLGLKDNAIYPKLSINERTWYRWLASGNRDIELGKKNTLFARLCQEIKKAESDCELNWLSIIIQAAQGERTKVKITKPDGTIEERLEMITKPTWTAAAWLLERRFPENYAKDKEVKDMLHDILQKIGSEIEDVESKDARRKRKK